MLMDGGAGIWMIARRPPQPQKEEKMQPQIYNKFAESRFQGFGSVRSPIQCEGIERGHRRIAKIGTLGSVNPQDFLGTLGGLAKQYLPDIMRGIGSFF
jgi:hypothetical protein